MASGMSAYVRREMGGEAFGSAGSAKAAVVPLRWRAGWGRQARQEQERGDCRMCWGSCDVGLGVGWLRGLLLMVDEAIALFWALGRGERGCLRREWDIALRANMFAQGVLIAFSGDGFHIAG